MDKIIQKILAVRNQKGLSYENMAAELNLSASAYRKIECGETKLTVERLYQISEILETPITELLDIKTERVFNQDIKESSYINVEHIYQDNKEVYEKLLQSKDQQIELLKSLLERK